MSYLPIPRHYIFVLQRGTYVVRLSEDSVWDLEAGQKLAYNASDFGRAITDGDLRVLHNAGFVDTFTIQKVFIRQDIAASIESGKRGANRIRAYYITTAIEQNDLEHVEQTLSEVTISHVVVPAVRDGVVVLYGSGGQPFTTLYDAEKVLQQIVVGATDLFAGASVSVYEVSHYGTEASESPSDATLRTQTAKRVETDKTPTKGKTAVVVGGGESIDQKLIRNVLADDLEMKVYICQSSREAIPIIEDYRPDIVLVDLQLSDTHGWPFIR
ncbi:MAG: hypothetical protein AAFV33_08895, partial [Chloroflexota bacterium]